LLIPFQQAKLASHPIFTMRPLGLLHSSYNDRIIS